ncbi:MAG TPA: hypothetical protein VGK20_05015 [Candidatus Binatia bacterium]|jgi:hypothetical protein
MRAIASVAAALLVVLTAVPSRAADQPTPDDRFPVPVSPSESVRQKTEMRSNLVALRSTLSKLADKDFKGVEASLRGLVHTGDLAHRPGVKTEVFRKLEKQFEDQVDKTVEAARSGQTEVVLRALSETMAYCQSCHMAFRQAVDTSGTAEPKH